MGPQLIKKKLNSTELGALFRHFRVSRVITTAHAHKSGVIFHISKSFQTKKKIKALRPKMTKIASRGSCLNLKKALVSGPKRRYVQRIIVAGDEGV